MERKPPGRGGRNIRSSNGEAGSSKAEVKVGGATGGTTARPSDQAQDFRGNLPVNQETRSLAPGPRPLHTHFRQTAVLRARKQLL